MTQQVSDETLGWFARKQADQFARVRAGSLDPHALEKIQQMLIDAPNTFSVKHLL